MTQQGLFISFEGGDGVGKSTQVAALAARLGSAGWEVVATREPGGTELGQSLRQLVLHGQDMFPRAEALLYAADRAQHVAQVIQPALARGACVITDRYIDSSLAYQAGGRQLPADDVALISAWAAYGLMPDLTVLLDLDPSQASDRWQEAPDRLERAGSEFHIRTREAFLNLAKAEPERWLVIDATHSIEQIAQQVFQEVQARIAQRTARPTGASPSLGRLGTVDQPGGTRR